jgi:glutathione S-transferase
MLTLHQMQMSGNCYKVRLAARQLGIPLRLAEYPLMAGNTRKPEFLAKNPNGRVPLL